MSTPTPAGRGDPLAGRPPSTAPPEPRQSATASRSASAAASGPVAVRGEAGRPTGRGWLGPPPRALYSAGWVLLPLRAFLGITFCFAGLQKLANPAFFDPSNPASIQSQLEAASRRSPVHSLLGPLIHVATPIGILIALGELAVGLGTLLGLWTRIAAAGGAAISFMLFLTVSYHSSPYYTGSDIVFFFAWWPLILAGSGGALSLDEVATNRERVRMGAEATSIVPIPFAVARRVCGAYDAGYCRALRGAPCEPSPCPFLAQRPARARRLDAQEIDRRTFAARGVAAGAVAAVGVFVAGAAAVLGRAAGGTTSSGNTPSLGSGTATTNPTTNPTTNSQRPPGASPSSTSPPATQPAQHAPTTTAPRRPAGTAVGPARDVPVGGAASFRDPGTGDPSLVVQPQAGTFLAFDAVCPHAGCSVQYDGTSKIFICPCHGSEFNGSTGAVEVGPATRGLTRIGISEGSDGELYVT